MENGISESTQNVYEQTANEHSLNTHARTRRTHATKQPPIDAHQADKQAGWQAFCQDDFFMTQNPQ